MPGFGRALSYVVAFVLGGLFLHGYLVAKADKFRSVQPIPDHLSFAFPKGNFDPRNGKQPQDHPDLAREADGSMPKERSEEGGEKKLPPSANELELRSLGSRNVNEGVTRERYVRYSSLQLTNVSKRTVKVEEWWINRRKGDHFCSKTAEMETSALGEAEKLKQETGRDISALFGRQLRPLRPGEFITLAINNGYCGSIFRVDVKTDRQTEFWTVD